MAAASLQLRLKIWDLVSSSVSLYSQLCETLAEKPCKTRFMCGGGEKQVLVLDLWKSLKQISSILTAKNGERNTWKPGLKKTDYKLSKVSKFPTTPSCGCAGKVFPSRLCESSKGLHHWTACKTMVATYCNMEEMPHVGWFINTLWTGWLASQTGLCWLLWWSWAVTTAKYPDRPECCVGARTATQSDVDNSVVVLLIESHPPRRLYTHVILYISPLSLSEWVFIGHPCLIQLELMHYEPHTKSQQWSAYSITSVIIWAIHQMGCDCRGSGIERSREVWFLED